MFGKIVGALPLLGDGSRIFLFSFFVLTTSISGQIRRGTGGERVSLPNDCHIFWKVLSSRFRPRPGRSKWEIQFCP